MSDVQLEPRPDSKSSLGVDTSVGPTPMVRTLTWTPPLSVEGSTPTWTEGTPSFTESSSSGDLGMLANCCFNCFIALLFPHSFFLPLFHFLSFAGWLPGHKKDTYLFSYFSLKAFKISEALFVFAHNNGVIYILFLRLCSCFFVN